MIYATITIFYWCFALVIGIVLCVVLIVFIRKTNVQHISQPKQITAPPPKREREKIESYFTTKKQRIKNLMEKKNLLKSEAAADIELEYWRKK